MGKHSSDCLWDLLEAQSSGTLNSDDKDRLIILLCESLERCKRTLNWYGDGNHMVSTWYQRANKELCKEVLESNDWRDIGTEDHEYIEKGSRAEQVAIDEELPNNIIEKLTLNLTKKVNNMQNTANKTQDTVKFDRSLSKEQWKQAVCDFKAFNADKENGPYYDSEGTKHKGNLRFMTYIFYAMLRGKNVSKTTHNVASENYTTRLEALRCFSEDKEYSTPIYYYAVRMQEELKLIQMCFPSLSTVQIKNIIKAAL